MNYSRWPAIIPATKRINANNMESARAARQRMRDKVKYKYLVVVPWFYDERVSILL